MTSPAQEQRPTQAVRFSDEEEENNPSAALPHAATPTVANDKSNEQLDPRAENEIRNLSKSIQGSRCQARRMENFSFEPYSVPTSRAPSPSPASRTTSGHSGHRASIGPRPSPPASAMHSPPLTPAGTSSQDGKSENTGEQKRGRADPAMVTPQVSPPHEPPPTSIDSGQSDRRPQSLVVADSPRESRQPSPRPSSTSDVPGVVGAHPKHPPTFSVAPHGDSLPPSRDPSPSGSTGVRTPAPPTSGTSTPNYGRPFTPSGDKDDPYSRSRRPPQPRNLDSLDARFIFGHRDHRKPIGSSNSMASLPLPRSKGTASETSSLRDEKRSSIFGGVKHFHHSSGDDSEARSSPGKQHHHGSMSELKRFFKLGGKHKEKRAQSPTPSVKGEKSSKSKKTSAFASPPPSQGSGSVPFADDHGLQSKYGKFGKVLGSGAGGSVRLMKRSTDGVTFAVKQFRARHSYETERDYNKKVTAEFCIGSTLHHGNIIETMDLVNEKGNFYVVMEYAPYDLFAIVMTGKMSREEVTCCTLQILSGVTYLHSMGLAHRDLKLDNVVVNEHGIMKIIDFGSATVFRYPFENDVVLASGIVGSDPYLAPEVYDLSKYDPQPTDIWSLAIIFCCMTLRRFPWKAPRVSDNSYKLFVSPPNDGPRSITHSSQSYIEPKTETGVDDRRQIGPQSEPPSRQPSDSRSQSHHHHHHHRKDPTHSDPALQENQPNGSSQNNSRDDKQTQVIKGPWRLLRLLPRESRHIIGRMLELDPKKRATLEEILDDKWVKNSQVCAQEEAGTIIRAENHEHTLEPGSTPGSAPATKQK